MADLAGAIDDALASTVGTLQRALDSISSSLSFQLGFLGIELSKSARKRSDPVLAARSLTRVLVEAASRQQLVVVVDEFSGADCIRRRFPV